MSVESLSSFKAALFSSPTSSHASFDLLPQPVILLHPSAVPWCPSHQSQTSTVSLSDVLVRSLVTSTLQRLLTTTYIYSWRRGSCGSHQSLQNRPVMGQYCSTMTPTWTCTYKTKSLKLKAVLLRCWTIFLLLWSICSALSDPHTLHMLTRPRLHCSQVCPCVFLCRAALTLSGLLLHLPPTAQLIYDAPPAPPDDLQHRVLWVISCFTWDGGMVKESLFCLGGGSFFSKLHTFLHLSRFAEPEMAAERIVGYG